MYKNQAKPHVGAEVLKFFDWCYANGDGQAQALDYIPLPDSLKNAVRASWKRNITAGGKPVF